MNRYFKMILSVILPIIILLGGAGCMNVTVNENKIKLDVIDYLENKYNQNFKILDSKLIFDPSKNTYSSVVCIDDVYNRPFRVFHMLDKTSVNIDDLDIQQALEKFNGTEINDEYGNIVIGCKYEEVLQNVINEDVFVLCQMELDDYFPSKQDIDSEIDTCLYSLASYAYPKIFVFYSENSTDKDTLINKVQQSVSKYNLSIQYIFLCSVEIVDEENILSDYGTNWNNYEDFVVDKDSTVKRIDGFYCTSEDGVSDLQLIKE